MVRQGSPLRGAQRDAGTTDDGLLGKTLGKKKGSNCTVFTTENKTSGFGAEPISMLSVVAVLFFISVNLFQ